MFSTLTELASALDALVIPVDERALATAVELLSTFQAKVTEAVAAFDRNRLWDINGSTSMTGWLRDHGMTPPAAARVTRTAVRVAGLPVTSSAWAEGKLTAGQVDIITAHLRDQSYVDLFADHEHAHVPTFAPLTIPETKVAVADWRARADAILNRPEPPDRDNTVNLSHTLDGRWEGRFNLDNVAGQCAHRALLLAMTKDVDGEPRRTSGQRKADAFNDIIRFYLDHQNHRPRNRHRPHLNVIVESDGHGGWKGHFPDRTPLRDTEVDTLMCDCVIHRHLTDDSGGILDHGVGRYTAGTTLFNALVVRDGGCRFPGCDRPPQWCDAHHVVPFPSGPTNARNMVLLCNRHHHHIHRKGWSVRLTELCALEVTAPDATVRVSHPPGALAHQQWRTPDPRCPAAGEAS